jgi:hypothetical protein
MATGSDNKSSPKIADRDRGSDLGAYGLRLAGLAGAESLLLDAPAGWIEWRTAYRPGKGQPAEFVDDTSACLHSEPDGWVNLDRATKSSTFNLSNWPDQRRSCCFASALAACLRYARARGSLTRF